MQVLKEQVAKSTGHFKEPFGRCFDRIQDFLKEILKMFQKNVLENTPGSCFPGVFSYSSVIFFPSGLIVDATFFRVMYWRVLKSRVLPHFLVACIKFFK